MNRLEEIIERLRDARQWAKDCGDRDGSFQEGMYPQKELPGDLDYLIALAKESIALRKAHNTICSVDAKRATAPR